MSIDSYSWYAVGNQILVNTQKRLIRPGRDRFEAANRELKEGRVWRA